ncbi:MAG: lysis protein [Enterobacterales bacterium endosymbiont of Blomia tropicalis]|uniref:lysis protein n=1 Tax=Mixta mediterraneensis TaxID=2758443 RepID=UPI0025A86862|nr:lysis protein [Mixta mediterraneensis]MDL4916158.1 lysis protein [Mixta mediterraneensis]
MNWKTLICGVLLAAVVALFHTTVYYRDLYASTSGLAETRQKTVVDMQARQRVVADIDAKYTRELTDAKATIDQLERSVIAGNQRLRVNASCKSVSSRTTASGLDDASRAGLTDTAQRDYFTLRKRIEKARSQIAGLQDYIRNVCFAPKE